MRPSQSCILLKRLGRNIRRVRKQKTLSQYKLADLFHINRSYLAEVEKGKENPTVKFLYKIAKVMRVKVEELTENM